MLCFTGNPLSIASDNSVESGGVSSGISIISCWGLEIGSFIGSFCAELSSEAEGDVPESLFFVSLAATSMILFFAWSSASGETDVINPDPLFPRRHDGDGRSSRHSSP